MNMLQSLSGVTVPENGKMEIKPRLLATVKKEVKHLMEEAVTKKYIHEESSSVTSLCAAVEACLNHGLRRRALGLFKTSSTTALIQKIAKVCPEADYISRRLVEFEIINGHNNNIVSGKRASSSSDSIIMPKILSKGSSISVSGINTVSSTSSLGITTTNTNNQPKYLWIRLALYEKRLSKIIEHLVCNASTYYDRDALVADADYGSILSSLLVGPCALEFTQAKNMDPSWTDSNADELMQRHRISSGNRTPPTSHRPIINFRRSLNTSSEDTSSCSYKPSSPANVAKVYVESLHQNSKTTLLYGKNNVLVLPKDVNEPMPGYLSLHQNVQSLIIKWTPNQLMNNYEDDGSDKSSYWTYALNINVDEIVYVHCHQNRGEDTGGTIILVGPDGVQRPPIHFPEGGHMQAFLSCLETGLLPHGQLDPPLWSQRGIGNMFPWPKSMRRRILPSLIESQEEVPIDYVFRVVSKSHHQEFLATHPILEFGILSPRRKHLSSCSTTGSSECSSKSLSVEQSASDSPLNHGNQNASIELVCTSMRRQIISRAFYGWLAYCRHLSTVRTHLSGLVNGRITPDYIDENGLTKEKWQEMHENGIINNSLEFFRSVYFGGVEPEIRKEVWPYLLGHYSFGSSYKERAKLNETCKHYYETTMSEWLAVEAIVQQREKEKTAEAAARFSAEKNRLNNKKFNKHQHHEFQEEECPLENDVFEENDYSDISDLENDIDMEIENVNDVPLKKHIHIDRDNDSSKKCSTTDSGNVEDDAADENNELQKEKPEPTILTKDSNEHLILHEDNFNVPQGLEVARTETPNILMVSIKSSPSTSSYETVGNEFIDMDINEVLNTSGDGLPCEISKCSTPITPQDVNTTRLVKYHSADDVNAAVNNNISSGLPQAVIIYEAASMDVLPCDVDIMVDTSRKTSIFSPLNEDITVVASLDALQEPKSACVSPASSNGGVYSSELLENFGLNLHRIEKDVQRCDRNYWYFANENLDKLRNVISTYVWEHLDVGYMQGMCDLVAPLLVIFDDESLTYSCFCKLMERMIENFPNGGAMDMHFANMRSLIQILDSEMYDLMDSNGDYTHFYFCYRWFLLDFKREFVYDDVFTTWEVIWAAKHVASANFVLFLALALLETYRDIILSNSMGFTDVIKFFNEMAERHNAAAILQLARSLVLQLQTIIENK